MCKIAKYILFVYVNALIWLVSTKQPPHIIVIIADDLGWNDISFHGSNEIPTPNLDALAYYGVILQSHYVLPSCTPSRTAFYTGRYPIRDGLYNRPLLPAERLGIPLNVTLLPRYLKELGYSTHLIGKWHVGYHTKKYTPSRRGFDHFFGFYNGFVTFKNHSIRYYMDPTMVTLVPYPEKTGFWGYDLHRDRPDKMSIEYSLQYMTDLMTDEAVSVISNHDSKKPLFLVVSHHAPHRSQHKDYLEVRDEREVNITLGHILDYKKRKYAGMITALDESVGQVVTALQRSNMLENAVILFFSDNGAPLGDDCHGSNYPLRGEKFTLFEGGIRAASFIYSPLIKKPSRYSWQMIHVTDWLPTFYKLAGGNIEHLENIDGVNQWPAISNDENSNRHNLLINIDDQKGVEAVRNERFKLIKGVGPCCNYEEYDIRNDKFQSHYNALNILNSSTGLIMAHMSKSPLKIHKINELRQKRQILCKKSVKVIDCTSKCLFDINNDICETTDVSHLYPEVVENLSNVIEHYKSVMMNTKAVHIDEAGLPHHLNGLWIPWVEDDA